MSRFNWAGELLRSDVEIEAANTPLVWPGLQVASVDSRHPYYRFCFHVRISVVNLSPDNPDPSLNGTNNILIQMYRVNDFRLSKLCSR